MYPPELDGKNLFLQTSQTGVIEHGKIKLALALKPHPFQLVFIVLRNALGMLPEQKSNYQSYPAVTAQATVITGLTIRAVVAQMLWE